MPTSGRSSRGPSSVAVGKQIDHKPLVGTSKYIMTFRLDDMPAVTEFSELPRVLAGELSPYAGMVEAGFRKRPGRA